LLFVKFNLVLLWSYQSIGVVFQLARLSSAFSSAADTPQLFLRVAEWLAASPRPRTEVVMCQSGVDASSMLLGGAQVPAARDSDELAVIPTAVTDSV